MFEIGTFLCSVALIIFCLANVKSIYQPFDRTNENLWFFLLWLLMVSFALFFRPFSYDYIGYEKYYETEYFGYEVYHHNLEPFYLWLIDLLPYSYMLWRFVVWGLAATLILASFKVMRCNARLATLFFCCFPLLSCFYYLRNTLGFAVLYLGLAILVNSESYFKVDVKHLLAYVLIICSVFFHRSMEVYVAVSLVSFFLPFNKKMILIMLLFFPILYYSIQNYALDIFSANLFGDETSNLGLIYLEQSNTARITSGQVIYQIIQFIPFIYIVFYAIYDMDRNKEKYENLKYVVFLKIYFLLFFIAFLFLGQSSRHIFLRFWKTSYLPLCFFLVPYFMDLEEKKPKKIFFGTFCFYLMSQYVLFPIMNAIIH